MDFLFRRSYRGRVKVVILDWAGTTVDYGSFAPAAVFLRLFASYDMAISSDDARSGMGLMKKDHLRKILSLPSVRTAWEAVHKSPPNEKDLEKLFTDFIPMQLEVLKDFADPISGLLEGLKAVREQGIGIGSTTGYIREMMDVLAPEAARRGYEPDYLVCSDDVPTGRPAPWMAFRNAIALNAYPMEAIVKVGDTLPDIAEGLNAGMWSVGLSLTSSLLAKNQDEVDALSVQERHAESARVAKDLYHAGAHLVVDGIWDLPLVVEEINQQLAQGERP